MLNIDMEFDNIKISSLNQHEIIDCVNWIKENEITFLNENEDSFNFNERYIESCLSEGEFFCSIKKDNSINGLLKGRVEFNNKNFVWISCFILDEPNKDYKQIVLNNIISYFYSKFDAKAFSTGLIMGEEKIKFWNKLGFVEERICNSFFNFNGTYKDMIILTKLL